MRFVKRVNERGTTTLPSEVRAVLNIEEGDIVEFEVLNVIKGQGKKPRANKTEGTTVPAETTDIQGEGA